MFERTTKVLQYLFPFSINRTSEIVKVNPTATPTRKEPENIVVEVYHYDESHLEIEKFDAIAPCAHYKNKGRITWINMDGLRKKDVEALCSRFEIHPLIQEDILHEGQRPKMDEIGNILFYVCNMLYYNEKDGTVEQEQISVALGKNFVISFQEDESRDVFSALREKLKLEGSKVRRETADYLCYCLLDHIVDNYFLVMEKLGHRIEEIEEEIQLKADKSSFIKLNILRKELMVLQRSVKPVRELINGFLKSDNELLDVRNIKYYKDVYDHIVQAADLSENYRDITLNLQDLYLSNVNLKMNEVMKVMTITTCLLAPATVIGGIFGMNFDKLPYIHHQYGFYIAVFLMLIIPAWMLWMFQRRGWF
jgi:magnesium transporter